MPKECKPPLHRCGFELEPNDVSIESGDPQRVGPKEWHKQEESVCCWRETWQNTDQCVWHAKVDNKPISELKSARTDNTERLDGAYLAKVVADDDFSFQGCILRHSDFSNGDFSIVQFDNTDLGRTNFHCANLYGAQFNDANLYRAQFDDADLRGARFHEASLSSVRFHDADLTGAQFRDADLTRANCTDADATGTDFTHATLQNALLTRADCRGATFTSALLYETVFADTRVNSQTTFHDPEATFYNSITSRPAVVYEENPLTSEDLPENIDPLEAAEWVYRRLEKLHDENALSEQGREYHISKEEARRKYQYESEEYARYAVSTLQWYVTGHGESIPRIFRSAAVLILVCGGLYPFVGGFESSSAGAAYRLHLFSVDPSRAAIGDTIATVLQSIYFSVITFTTIGYGDLYPTGAGSKILVGFESLSGAILIALFVFVLGRRVAR